MRAIWRLLCALSVLSQPPSVAGPVMFILCYHIDMKYLCDGVDANVKKRA